MNVGEMIGCWSLFFIVMCWIEFVLVFWKVNEFIFVSFVFFGKFCRGEETNVFLSTIDVMCGFIYCKCRIFLMLELMSESKGCINVIILFVVFVCFMCDLIVSSVRGLLFCFCSIVAVVLILMGFFSGVFVLCICNLLILVLFVCDVWSVCFMIVCWDGLFGVVSLFDRSFWLMFESIIAILDDIVCDFILWIKNILWVLFCM